MKNSRKVVVLETPVPVYRIDGPVLGLNCGSVNGVRWVSYGLPNDPEVIQQAKDFQAQLRAKMKEE